MMLKTRFQSTLMRALPLALAASLASQTAMAVELEEIIVTAQKRSQSLQDVPLSVIAVSGEELKSLNRNEITELTKSVAGFTFQTGSGDSERAVQIRGVGTSTFSKGVEQSVGTVIDGVVAGGLVASFLDFNDVERVEVLRGPQGMLFGKNASAGLLNIVTQGPTDDLSYGASATFGDEGEQKLSGYLSGSLGAKVKGRISAYSNERDGFIVNNNAQVSGDYNNRDETGFNAKLLIEPSDDLSILLNYRTAEREYSCCYRPPVTVVGPFAAALPQGVENDRIFDITTFSPNSTELDLFSAEINYQLSENTLTSITSFTDTFSFSNIVATGLPLDLLNDNQSADQTDQFTQEIRITSPGDRKFSYVAGLYYYKNELDRFQTQVFNPPFSRQATTAGFEAKTDVESSSLSVFAQGTWKLNDVTRLSLGLRYNDEEVTLDQSVTNRLGALRFPNPGRSTTVDDNAVSWRLTAERDVGESKMLYATVARGYKGPGANTLPSGLAAAKPIVDAEIPTNYEVGLKSEWLDGSLRLNVNAFLTEFEDFQASLSDNNIPPAFFLSNAGKLETKGVEVELTRQTNENLYLSANLALIDAQFDTFIGAQCYPTQSPALGCVGGVQDLSGKDLPFSPDLTFNLFARYDIPLTNMPFNMYVQGAYHWQDDVQFNTSNDPGTIQESYGLADFAIGLESNEGNYSLQLYVKNAFDEFYSSGFTTQGTPFGVLLAQNLEYDYTRRAGVTLRVDF